jgi:hypothetical protein
MVTIEEKKVSARLVTLEAAQRDIIPLFLNPPPSVETLRNWFDAAKIPKFKANPCARRGGGTVFYSTAGIEKFFRSRTF